MPLTSYAYSIADDFPNDAVGADRLQAEITAAGLPGIHGVSTSGDVCKVTFQDALTSPQEATLDGVVAAHVGTPLPPVPGPGSTYSFGCNSISSAADTRYMTLGYDTGIASTVVIEYLVPRAGTFRNMHVRQNAAPGTALAQPVAYKLRVNGADTALTVSRNANAGIGSAANDTDTAQVSKGDRFSIVAVKAQSIGSGVIIPTVSVEFA